MPARYNSPCELVCVNTDDRKQHCKKLDLFAILQHQMKNISRFIACIAEHEKEKYFINIYNFETLVLHDILPVDETIHRFSFINSRQLAIARPPVLEVYDVVTHAFLIRTEATESPNTLTAINDFIIYDAGLHIVTWNIRTNEKQVTNDSELAETFDIQTIDSNRFASGGPHGKVIVWQLYPLQKLFSTRLPDTYSIISVDNWLPNQLICADTFSLQVFDLTTRTIVEKYKRGHIVFMKVLRDTTTVIAEIRSIEIVDYSTGTTHDLEKTVCNANIPFSCKDGNVVYFSWSGISIYDSNSGQTRQIQGNFINEIEVVVS